MVIKIHDLENQQYQAQANCEEQSSKSTKKIKGPKLEALELEFLDKVAGGLEEDGSSIEARSIN